MLLVKRAQNLVSQITPQFFKTLSPLMQKVLGVGGVLLVTSAAIWVYRLRAAPSLMDRVKNDREQFHQIRLILYVHEELKVDIQRKQVISGGFDETKPEAVSWIKSFAGEMELHLSRFKQELLTSKDEETKKQGMELVDSLLTTLMEVHARIVDTLPNTNDRQAIEGSVKNSIKEINAILTEVGEQLPPQPGLLQAGEIHGPGTVATLLKVGTNTFVGSGNRISMQFVNDLPSFQVFVQGVLVEDTAPNLVYDKILACLNLGGGTAVYNLTKLLANKHFERSHQEVARLYFYSKGLNHESAGKQFAKVEVSGEGRATQVKLRLIQTYRATTETTSPAMRIANPPALIVEKTLTIPLIELAAVNCDPTKFAITESSTPVINVAVALKKINEEK